MGRSCFLCPFIQALLFIRSTAAGHNFGGYSYCHPRTPSLTARKHMEADNALPYCNRIYLCNKENAIAAFNQ